MTLLLVVKYLVKRRHMQRLAMSLTNGPHEGEKRAALPFLLTIRGKAQWLHLVYERTSHDLEKQREKRLLLANTNA